MLHTCTALTLSPLMPLIFLAISNFCLISGDLVRLRLLEECRIVVPFLGFEQEARSFQGVDAQEQRLVYLLECPPWQLPWIWLLFGSVLTAFIFFALSNGRPIWSLDGRTFDILFFLSAVFIYTYFSLMLLRFVCVWIALHRLLRRLYWHPTRAAYEKLRIKTLPDRPEAQRIRLIEPRPTLTATEYCLERARDILRLSVVKSENYAFSKPEDRSSVSTSLQKRIAARRVDLDSHIRDVESLISENLKYEVVGDWRAALRSRAEIHSAMRKLSGFITGCHEPLWRLSYQSETDLITPVEDNLAEQVSLFIASRVVDLLRQVFPQLKTLAGFAMAGALAMMLAFSTYPFEHRDTLISISWIVLLSVITTGLFVFVQINRCRVVSMLSGTQPGRFNFDSAFFKQLLTFGVIPILTLLGAQFPGTFGGLLSWISQRFGAG